MTDHFLKRNADNEPICHCGYRPEILDTAAPVGKLWKAKTAVLNHIDAVAKLSPAPSPRRSPNAPFNVSDQMEYPRAGVRQMEDGQWLLSCWEIDRIVRVVDEPVFKSRVEAMEQGWLIVGACRQSGSTLNGWAAA